MHRYRGLVALLCLCALLMSACGETKSVEILTDIQPAFGLSQVMEADTTVVFIPKLTGNAFFEAANDGAQAYAAKHGFKVDYRGSEEANIEHQIDIVRQAVADRVDAICVSSLDATALDETLKEAMAAGIQVVTWDADVSPDARSIMVSQGTPDQLGKMLVEMGARSLSSRGKKPASEPIRYAWHYSQASVADQNSWCAAGEEYISRAYPNWQRVQPDNFYSYQDDELAVEVGRGILEDYPDIDLIICNDSTALPGQAEAAKQLGLGAGEVSITGFASPRAMREYCREGILERWGLWDCQVQGQLGCYFAYYLASGNRVKVGDKINVPDIGVVEILPNSVLNPADPDAAAMDNLESGVVLLPNRSEYTAENVDDFDF